MGFDKVGGQASPEEQPVTQSVYPHLDWTDADADEYVLDLSPNAEFSAVRRFAGILASEFTVPVKLQYGTTYYWKVEAVKGGMSEEWESGSFTTVATDETTLYRNDFDLETTGPQLPAGWQSYIQGTTSQVGIADFDGNGNKAIKLDKTAEDGFASPGVIYNFGRTMDTGTMTVSFNVYRTVNQHTFCYTLGYEGAGTGRQSDKQAFAVQVDYDKHYVNWNDVRMANIADQWHAYQIVADLYRRTFDLYIDNSKVTAQPVSFREGVPIEQFAVFTFAGGKNGWGQYASGPYYVDRVEIRIRNQSPKPAAPVHLAEDIPVRTSFSWDDAKAQSYILVIDDSPDFGSPERIISGITDAGYTLTEEQALDYNKSYYWKVIASGGGTTWADDAVYSFTTQLDATGDKLPSLFEAVPASARPDDTVALFGHKLSESDIHLFRLPDTCEADIRASVGLDLPLESMQPPSTGTIVLSLFQRKANSVSAAIPGSTDKGMYAVWARNNSKWSLPVALNRTEVYFVSPDIVDLCAEREVRVIGKHLSDLNGSGKAYVYLRECGGTGQIYPVTLKKAASYDLSFDLPDELPKGEYEVWVHNGHGGAYGWGEVHRIAVKRKQPAGVYPIVAYGAIPDDDTVDTAAIQAAADAAAAAGGGTVLVPPGKYLFDAAIRLGPNVTLKGAGKDDLGEHLSVLKFKDGPPIGPASGGLGPEMIRMESGGGMKDLRLVGSVSVDRGIVIRPGATDVNISCNRIDNFFPTEGIKGYFSGVFGSGMEGFKRITVENNEFEGYNAVNIDGLEYGKISGNTIRIRRFTPVVFTSASKNIIEGNRIDGRNTDGRRKANRGITFNTGPNEPGWKPTEKNYVAYNVIEYVGDEVAPTNDGEYVLFDSNADSDYRKVMHYGEITEAGPDNVKTAGVNWENDQMKSLYVLIVEGKGIGQYRKVTGNTADTLNVEKNWIVIPDYTSKLTVTRFFVKNIVLENTARYSKENNFMVWGNGIGNVLDGNTSDAGGVAAVAMDTAKTDMYFPAYFNVIDKSAVRKLQIGYYEYARGAVPRSVGLLGNVIRNSAAGSLRLFANSSQQGVNALNQLMEHNSVTSGIVIMSHAQDTLLRNNRILGSAVRYYDQGTRTVIVDYPVPAAPSQTVTEAYDGYVKVRWNSVEDAEGYYVLRSESDEGPYSVLNGGEPVAGMEFTDDSALPRKLYYYKTASWKQAYGQGDASAAAGGFNGSGVFASPLDFSSTQGVKYWYYYDDQGPLHFENGRWTNAGRTVTLDARTTQLTAGTAVRQWVVPYDGKVHLLGTVTKLAGDDGAATVRLMINDAAITEKSFTSNTVTESTSLVSAGDIVRFALAAGGQSAKTYATEFAVDYTREAPIPAVPENGARDTDLRPLLRWTPVRSAESYGLVLDDDPDFNSPLLVKQGLPAAEYRLEEMLEPQRTYYWKVSARSGDESWEAEQSAASFVTGDAGWTTTFQETYNLLAAGPVPDGYRVITGKSGTAGVADIPGEFDKSLRLFTPGDNSAPSVSFDLQETIASGMYEISWQAMYTGHEQLHYSVFPGSGDLPWSSAAKGLFVAYGRYYVNWLPANAFPVKPNEWQQVKMALDMDTKQYQVYIDGRILTLNDGTDTFSFHDEAIRTITVNVPYGRWNGAVYIDDVKVRKRG
ncbi:right-handed parallel beta-helix repeat-containing protein [Paenibacillus alkalitolerans]|uniref:right-handed parallel beta-helix repeat-containing protein n=1 Tax=Paenibacillus alkalitolerans TaxID=2799335 RepID=UPI0018F78D15|nr:right-handed parallel beta-helix repeat-containing protein [Paenibacillus alkalitolerans]